MTTWFPIRMRSATAAISLLLCAQAVGCGSTQMAHSWKSPMFKGPAFRKILVIGKAARPEVRQLYEDAFVRQLQTVGAAGTASYPLLADAQTADRAAIDRAVAQAGADAVLVTRLVKMERRDVVVPPEPGVQDRIDSAWPGTYTPVVAGQTDIATLEVKLFDAASGQLVWSATMQEFNAGDLQRATAGASRTIVKELVRKRLL